MPPSNSQALRYESRPLTNAKCIEHRTQRGGFDSTKISGCNQARPRAFLALTCCMKLKSYRKTISFRPSRCLKWTSLRTSEFKLQACSFFPGRATRATPRQREPSFRWIISASLLIFLGSNKETPWDWEEFTRRQYLRKSRRGEEW